MPKSEALSKELIKLSSKPNNNNFIKVSRDTLDDGRNTTSNKII